MGAKRTNLQQDACSAGGFLVGVFEVLEEWIEEIEHSL